MGTAIDRNRLADEASPYLRQHADNPVHWQPWDDAALAVADAHDRPIFLSVGYAACHWCHVMEEESFADPEVARVLNERFVPIKVDREERPDLDQFYQTACQVTSGRGGWPLSAWLTPDARPFQVATYLPKEARGGMPGFVDVLQRIADRWANDRAAIDAHADRIVEAVRRVGTGDAPEVEPADAYVADAAGAVLREVDWANGGFGSGGPKFPQAPRLALLLAAADRTGRDRYDEAVVAALRAMADGGIHDHVGGGFHRYATDAAWRIPHFEKMCYDNASLLELYARAATRYEDERFARVAHRAAAFMLRELRDEAGGFYASLDADTDGIEGATYLWTAEEIDAVVDDPATRSLLDERFALATSAELEGGGVLTVARTIEALAGDRDERETAVRSSLDDALEALRTARQGRPQPLLDDKVLAGWSGLAISAFATAGAHLDAPRYVEVARESLAFVEDALWHEHDRRLSRRYRDGEVGVPGFLEDYAALARGGFAVYRVTDDAAAGRFALALVAAMLDTCWDAQESSLRFAPVDRDDVPFDPLDGLDRSIPSALGLAVDVLATASGFVDDPRVDTVYEAVLDRFGPSVARRPADHATLAMAMQRWADGPRSVTVVADEVSPTADRRLAILPSDIVVTRRPRGDDAARATADDLGLDAMPPLWRDRDATADTMTVYPCRGRACGPPAATVEAALAWFDE